SLSYHSNTRTLFHTSHTHIHTHTNNLNSRVIHEPPQAPRLAETMSSSRKILFFVAFVATVAFIGLSDPAMGAPTSAAAGSVAAGSIESISVARLSERMAADDDCDTDDQELVCARECKQHHLHDTGECHFAGVVLMQYNNILARSAFVAFSIVTPLSVVFVTPISHFAVTNPAMGTLAPSPAIAPAAVNAVANIFEKRYKLVEIDHSSDDCAG
ncbi:MAG: hypothetical protein J3R72DRAFT_512994, partial [Linnemannia gamsii]